MELTQRQRIEILLRTFRDARETLQRGDAGGRMQNDSRILSMPAVWHDGDYELLDASIDKLRFAPNHHRHLTARYFGGERKTLTLVERTGKLFDLEIAERRNWIGEPWFVPHAEIVRTVVLAPTVVVRARRGGGDGRLVRVLVDRWAEWVIPRMVERGVDWLCWTMPEKPILPRAIYQAVSEGAIKVAA